MTAPTRIRATDVGDVYGRYTVVELLPSRRSKPGAKAKPYVRVRCECGQTREVAASNLRQGNTRSCGCAERADAGHLTLSAAPLLRVVDALRAALDAPETGGGTEAPPWSVGQGETLLEARRRGWVTFWWADEFCCKVLGVHPMSVWGDEYLTPGRSRAEVAA